MAITAGDFSPTDLQEAILKADQMWMDDMTRADFEANVDVLNAIRGEQNANVSILEESEKDRQVKITWVNNCDAVVEACSVDDCDIAGAEAGTDTQTYGIDGCIRYRFTVDEMDQRTNSISFGETVAKNFLRADKALSDNVAQASIAKIEAALGVNTVTTGVGTFNAGTGDTDIAAADWNERIFAYFYRVALMNKMPNPFLLSGQTLFDDRFLALMKEGNGEGKGDAKLFRSMRQYYDLFNIDTANTPDFKSYMINRGSMAFASKNYYGATPTRYKTQDRYSIASRNIAGMRFDVYYTNRCVGNTIKHDFMLKAHYDYFVNPIGCDANRTGFLSFNKI